MKRTFAILLTVIMLFTIVPATVSAESACTCDEPEISEWNYWKASAGDNWDCTDPNQIFERGGWCSCGGYYSETIPTQPEHVLVDLPLYDIDGKIIEENYKEASCDENGYVYYQCAICRARVADILSATGHTYGAAEVYSKCFSDGSTISGLYRRYCTKTGCEGYKEERITNHRCVVYDGAEASCYGEGRTEYVYCIDCNTESQSVTTPKLDHIDEDDNGMCDLCLSDYLGDGVYCSCICHSESGFMKLLMPLFKLIWQILGVDNCHGDCNAVHYE